MEPTDGPKHYSIEWLCDNMIQPFRDLNAEEFEVLKASLKGDKRSLAKQPVLLIEDGSVMYDGNQRCRALIALGRKRLNPDEVRIVPGVTRDNMWEHAIRVNANRRHLSGPDKAAAMHTMAGRGWSQTRIAKAFGMSRPGVTQLMAKYGPEDGTNTSDTTVGEDGKVYPRKPVERKPKEDRVWAIDGVGSKMIRRLRKMLKDEIPAGLAEYEKAALAEELESLGGAVQATIDYMETM